MKRAILILVIAALPSAAFAHMPIGGIGSFYNGALHPLFVPAQLLLLIAFGLLLGQKGLEKNLKALVAYVIGAGVGFVAAWFWPAGDKDILLLAGATLIGLLIATDLDLRSWAFPILALLVGLVLGIDSAQEDLPGRERFISLLGTGIVIYLAVLYLTTLAEYLQKKQWGKIGVRIVGSWVAASAVMVLALSIAKPT